LRGDPGAGLLIAYGSRMTRPLGVRFPLLSEFPTEALRCDAAKEVAERVGVSYDPSGAGDVAVAPSVAEREGVGRASGDDADVDLDRDRSDDDRLLALINVSACPR